ncbi:hypothetical protein NKI12_20120 [Mesorhizobium australicum]|uniref:Uncharacterized protein n=1 Tax=Mesorhizobium australicum TaxID=536018 RepID=A0ACC6SZJ1_9HYPH
MALRVNLKKSNPAKKSRRSLLSQSQVSFAIVMVPIAIAAYFSSDNVAALSSLPVVGSMLAAEPIAGTPSVIDGDAIEIHG